MQKTGLKMVVIQTKLFSECVGKVLLENEKQANQLP